MRLDSAAIAKCIQLVVAYLVLENYLVMVGKIQFGFIHIIKKKKRTSPEKDRFLPR